MIELYLILFFMIVCAIVAIEIKDLISSVVALGAVGLAMSMAFFVLKAPELAITQLVVEVLALIILIRATLKVDLPFSMSGRWLINTGITVLFVGMLVLVAYRAFMELPRFGYPIMANAGEYLKQEVQNVKAANVVSAITMDFRAYDTLGEATALFTAVIGVFVVARRVARKKVTDRQEEKDE